MAELLGRGEALERSGAALVVSICAGFPLADIYDVGPSVTVTVDERGGDIARGQRSPRTYSFSPGMRDIIKDSTLWGRVRTAVILAFTSKSLSLYELLTARINLEHVWEEVFSIRDMRALLGVPENKLLRMPDLLRNCINVAVAEVNGMADFGMKVGIFRIWMWSSP